VGAKPPKGKEDEARSNRSGGSLGFRGSQRDGTQKEGQPSASKSSTGDGRSGKRTDVVALREEVPAGDPD